MTDLEEGRSIGRIGLKLVRERNELVNQLMKFAALTLFVIGTCAVGSAIPAPEIDAGAGSSAIALIAGALLLVRSRR